MSEPTTAEEYRIRFDGNAWLEDYGLESAVHLPCPFCAAADFVVYKLLEAEMITRLEHVCRECSRGVRLLLRPIRGPGGAVGVSYEFVQTCGEDPPPWAPPMRRVPTERGGDA